MENNFNSPDQVILGNIKTGVVKAERPVLQMILLGIMAGAFIALGGAPVMWQYTESKMWDFPEHWLVRFSRWD